MKNNKSPITISILNWRDIHHPLAGGAEISLHEHAKYWIQRGARVYWYSSSWSEAKQDETIDGIKIKRMGSHYTVHLLFFLNYLTGKIPKTQILIDSFHFVPFFSPLFAKKSKVIALINEVAGDLWDSNMPQPFAFIGRKIEPLFFKIYKKNTFITSSDSTKNELLTLGISQKNIRLVPHGVTTVPVKGLVNKEKKPTILFLNRVSEDKGIGDLLQAFSYLQKNILDIQLWIVGKEEQEGILKVLLNKYNLGKNIKYFGFVSQKEKFELMKKAWVLVHPSKKEGWGLTVIEAASQGTPTIGYDVPGLRDSIQNNKTGLLVEPSISGIRSGVEVVVSNNSLRLEFGKNCIDWSKKFSWEIAGRKSWEVLRSVLD